MEKCRIGFLGGCISNQSGIPRNKHYYSLLLDSLRATFPGTDFTILLDTYTSFGDLGKKTTSVLEKKSPDILVVFIRPFPLLLMCKLWIKYPLAGKRTARTWHPAFLRPAVRNWPSRLTEFFTKEEYVPKPRSRFTFEDVNLLAGMVFGLNRWATATITREILSIQSDLEKQNKKLFVVSPPRNLESRAGNFISRKSGEKIGDACRDAGTGYINIYNDSLDLFEDDRVHYNEKGHRYLSEELFAALRPVLD